VDEVARPATVKPVRYVSLGLSAEDLAALQGFQRFQRRAGTSNMSETIRVISASAS
jgi:hypothetical protein